jgi:hypothetical protein
MIHECGEPQWNDTDRGNWRTRRETFPSATFSSNSTCIEPGTNPGLRGESPATNRLSHVTWLFFSSCLFTFSLDWRQTRRKDCTVNDNRRTCPEQDAIPVTIVRAAFECTTTDTPVLFHIFIFTGDAGIRDVKYYDFFMCSSRGSSLIVSLSSCLSVCHMIWSWQNHEPSDGYIIRMRVTRQDWPPTLPHNKGPESSFVVYLRPPRLRSYFLIYTSAS